LDLSSLLPLATDTTQLLDELNQRLLHGTLSADAKQTIAQAVNSLDPTDATGRVRMAVYLTTVSPQFQVER